MPSRHFQRRFTLAAWLGEFINLSICQIESAPSQLPQKYVLDFTPMAQNAVAFGAADQGELLRVLGDFQTHRATGSAFKTETRMPHGPGLSEAANYTLARPWFALKIDNETSEKGGRGRASGIW